MNKKEYEKHCEKPNGWAWEWIPPTMINGDEVVLAPDGTFLALRPAHLIK